MTILEMSLGGGVFIAVILVLRRALLYRVPKWTFLLLWAAALCRLMVPFAIPSPVSVYNGAAWVAEAVRLPAPPNPPAGADIPSIVFPENSAPEPPREEHQSPAAPLPTLPEKEPASPAAALYLAGAALCALFFGTAYFRSLRRFRDARPVEVEFLRRWQMEHPTPLPVRIKTSAAVSAPLAYGLARPVILLPQNTDWDNEDQLAYVLTHEYVHIRRGDLLWKLLLAAALCLHWCNPLVWAMYLCANRDLELACDEMVVRILGLDSRKGYAYALLSAAEGGFFPLCTTYATKNHMEERIRAIMKMKKKSLAAVLTALLLVAGVTTVFATAKAPDGVDGLPRAVQGVPPLKSGRAPGRKPASSAPVEEEKTPAAGTISSEPWNYDIAPAGDTASGRVNPLQPAGDTAAGRVDPLQPPAQDAPENRWGVPDGEIPQWTEFTVDSFEDAHELGKYLEAVHGLYPGDYTPGWVGSGSYIVQITYMERAVRQRLPDGRYPVNSKGETYGTAFDSQVVGCEPDLISAVATNGAKGYIVGRDRHLAGYPGEVNNPSDAMAYMEWLETQPDIILIPVYDVDRDNVIGYYGVSNSSGIITPEEELGMVEDQLRRNMGLSEEEIAEELEALKKSKGWS